jgi:transposase
MMGFQSDQQPKLFYPSINLEQRIPEQHVLRRIRSRVDFDFIYDEVRDRYGIKGNVSVPPPAILKMMLLLVLYNVRSERELMNTIPLRLDWLWFLGYDLDSEIPNHSVLSKARGRWGVEAFRSFFERIVWQCVEAGLVDGTKLFMDSSLIEADASSNSVVSRPAFEPYLVKGCRELEARLEEPAAASSDPEPPEVPKSGAVNRRHHSTTDPDASVMRQGKGRASLQYKIHRAVDGSHGIITATEVTPGEINEAHRLMPLVDQHRGNTGRSAETLVADTKYGTVENYLACDDRGLKAHIPDLKRSQENTGRRKGIFPEEAFHYHPETDVYVCPAGQTLRPRRRHRKQQAVDYLCDRGLCDACPLRAQCTTAKTGRSVKRHNRQCDLDRMRELARSKAARRDIRIRQHLMEGSFADAVRYGFKRARWRRLWRGQIQEYLTAAIQNMMKLLRYLKERGTPCAIGLSGATPGAGRVSANRLLALCEGFVCRMGLMLAVQARATFRRSCEVLRD